MRTAIRNPWFIVCAFTLLTGLATVVFSMSSASVTAIDGTVHDYDHGRDGGGVDAMLTVAVPLSLAVMSIRAVRRRLARRRGGQ